MCSLAATKLTKVKCLHWGCSSSIAATANYLGGGETSFEKEEERREEKAGGKKGGKRRRRRTWESLTKQFQQMCKLVFLGKKSAWN